MMFPLSPGLMAPPYRQRMIDPAAAVIVEDGTVQTATPSIARVSGQWADWWRGGSGDREETGFATRHEPVGKNFREVCEIHWILRGHR